MCYLFNFCRQSKKFFKLFQKSIGLFPNYLHFAWIDLVDLGDHIVPWNIKTPPSREIFPIVLSDKKEKSFTVYGGNNSQ